MSRLPLISVLALGLGACVPSLDGSGYWSLDSWGGQTLATPQYRDTATSFDFRAPATPGPNPMPFEPTYVHAPVAQPLQYRMMAPNIFGAP